MCLHVNVLEVSEFRFSSRFCSRRNELEKQKQLEALRIEEAR